MKQLLADIHTYCARAGISTATFGSYALNDSGFVARLEAGGECLPRTEARVRGYIAAHPDHAVRLAPASASTARSAA